MIDLRHFGQGPRPDLLEEELLREARIRKASGESDAEDDGITPEKSASESGNGTLPAESAGDPSEREAEKEKNKPVKFEKKDTAAIIIALFQLILPWIAIGVVIYFLVILLITKL